jgi:hypothetical protein
VWPTERVPGGRGAARGSAAVGVRGLKFTSTILGRYATWRLIERVRFVSTYFVVDDRVFVIEFTLEHAADPEAIC